MAADLLQDGPEATQDALRANRYEPFLSVAVLTDESAPMLFHGNYAIATPGLSFEVFNQASTKRVGPRKPGGNLMLFGGADGAARLMQETAR